MDHMRLVHDLGISIRSGSRDTSNYKEDVKKEFGIWGADELVYSKVEEVTSTELRPAHLKVPFFVKALSQYDFLDPSHLQFAPGTIIKVTLVETDEWHFGEYEDPLDGRNTGRFPRIAVEALTTTTNEGSELESGTVQVVTINSGHNGQKHRGTSSLAASSKLSPSEMEQILENDYDFPEDTIEGTTTEKLSSLPSTLKNSWGMFRCEHPSCWDRRDKFRFNTFTELARHYGDAHPDPIQNEWIPCDYSACKRAEDVFTRKDSYRDHLRDYHQEDIPRRHKSTKREQEWLLQRTLSTGALRWWRCGHCLIRVYVNSGGWVCSECQQSCEQERVAIQLIGRIDVNVGKNETSIVPSSPATLGGPGVFASDAQVAFRHSDYVRPFFCRISGCNASSDVLQTQRNLDTHYHEVHSLDLAELYTCDYGTCIDDPSVQSQLVLSGYEARVHLRDHHKEDLYWPNGKSPESLQWWVEHFTPADWWRCSTAYAGFQLPQRATSADRANCGMNLSGFRHEIVDSGVEA